MRDADPGAVGSPHGPAGEAYVDRLMDGLLAVESLHTPAASSSGYRNKAAYNLMGRFQLCPLAIPAANAIAAAVAAFGSDHSSQPLTFWREVSVKVTRRRSSMIRLTLCGGDLFAWLGTEAPAFVRHVRDLHPNVESVYYQHTLKGKPTKGDRYHLLDGDPYVYEDTPTGLAFRVSPDAFTEINHHMEDRVFAKMLEWSLPYAGCELLALGRDINAMVLSFNHAATFATTHALTHCPLVHADAVVNFAAHPEWDIRLTRCEKEAMGAAIAALPTGLRVAAALTSGRHGLKESLIVALRAKESVVQVIYNSCNPVSLKRDMLKFMTGPDGFIVADFHSFDFFPGTRYTASVTRLVRRPRTLVLPIGPAGVGKSYLAAHLQRFLPPATFDTFERDAVFAALRTSGASLKVTSTTTHEALEAALRQPGARVQYLDSTNGSPEARAHYRDFFQPALTLYVIFRRPEGIDACRALTDRTLRRDGHPAFPTAEEAQLEKHRRILLGIQWPDEEEVRGVTLLECDALDDATKHPLPWRLFLAALAPIGLRHPLTPPPPPP